MKFSRSCEFVDFFFFGYLGVASLLHGVPKLLISRPVARRVYERSNFEINL